MIKNLLFKKVSSGWLRLAGSIWGVIGVIYLIAYAIYSVYPHMIDAFKFDLNPYQWVIIMIWTVFMIYGEGYRSFQKKFSPRVAARSWHLIKYARTIDIILAPFYCIGYYHATKRRIIASWLGTLSIILLIVLVVQLPQPWRGISDSGVVFGLLYGLFATIYFIKVTFINKNYLIDPDITGFNHNSISNDVN